MRLLWQYLAIVALCCSCIAGQTFEVSVRATYKDLLPDPYVLRKNLITGTATEGHWNWTYFLRGIFLRPRNALLVRSELLWVWCVCIRLLAALFRETDLVTAVLISLRWSSLIMHRSQAPNCGKSYDTQMNIYPTQVSPLSPAFVFFFTCCVVQMGHPCDGQWSTIWVRDSSIFSFLISIFFKDSDSSRLLLHKCLSESPWRSEQLCISSRRYFLFFYHYITSILSPLWYSFQILQQITTSI